MEQLSTYYLDGAEHNYFRGEKGLQEVQNPVMAYDNDHQSRWQKTLVSGSIDSRNIYTLHSVNGPAPMRWLAGVVEMAQLLEGLSERGLNTPKNWISMAPIHINTAVNKGIRNESELHSAVGEGLDNARFLQRVAHGYLDRFHPEVPKPMLEIDDPTSALKIVDMGEEAASSLSDATLEKLNSMSKKHSSADDQTANSAAYLLAHFHAYGRVTGETGISLFRPKENPIFVLPQSEDTFIRMLEEEQGALHEIIGSTQRFSEDDSIILMSKSLRTPHYYPHRGEPMLADGKLLSSQGLAFAPWLNDKAFNEINQATQLIRQDIGGFSPQAELASVIAAARL